MWFIISAKGFVQCKKNDPGLGECIKTSLQSGIPHMVKGTQSFKKSGVNRRNSDNVMCLSTPTIKTHYVPGVPVLGLYPIDPLRINALGIDQGGGPVNIKLNFRDLDISNIGTAVIREIQ